ncbi:hypothetical protein GCM10010388_00640 [Streptomyces mauvecolor]
MRTQRVKVPMRLVSSPFYADVALSVYVKVKALAARPEGCEAKAATIAAYLGLSKASAERGLSLLSCPAPDGVVELRSIRRTLPGGRGLSAVRRTRPVRRAEGFVWLPVAAAEDLTPRQLRAFAVITYTQRRGIALTEGELAGHLRHHSGPRAGQPITVAAAGAVVDELEAARWVTVQRRAGLRGRHQFIAHDFAPVPMEELVRPVPDAVSGTSEAVQSCSQGPVDNAPASSLVGEGSGLSAGEGSLANRESPRTDSPDDERALLSSAVGEVRVVAVENPAATRAQMNGRGGLALRAGENSKPVSPNPKHAKRPSGRGSVRPSYTGPALSMSPQVYAVLEPVNWLLARVNNPFVVRQIAREVGRQLQAGMEPDRLRHRLTARFAQVMPDEIRDPGRWLLGIALPRWGCGHFDCEAGTMWSTGHRCDVCADVTADTFAARQRDRRSEQGLCPEHSQRLDASGSCPSCAPTCTPAPELPGVPRPRGERICCSCRQVIPREVRIVIEGRCDTCWQDQTAPGPSPADTGAAPTTVLQPVQRVDWRGLVAQQASRSHSYEAANGPASRATRTTTMNDRKQGAGDGDVQRQPGAGGRRSVHAADPEDGAGADEVPGPADQEHLGGRAAARDLAAHRGAVCEGSAEEAAGRARRAPRR